MRQRLPKKPKFSPQDEVFERAVGLLARREHSRLELYRKLQKKEFPSEFIERALDKLESKNWLSDERFADHYLRHRVNAGLGPRRIRYELEQKGVAPTQIEKAFEENSIDWYELAHTVWQKKYNCAPKDWHEKSKQIRFMQYRGFFSEHIDAALASAQQIEQGKA